jgi:hypothetical protein
LHSLLPPQLSSFLFADNPLGTPLNAVSVIAGTVRLETA